MSLDKAQDALKSMIMDEGEDAVLGPSEPDEERGNYDSSEEMASDVYEFDVNGKKRKFQLLDDLEEGEEITELGVKLNEDYQREMTELQKEREKFRTDAQELMQMKEELRQQIDYEYQLLQSEEMQQLKEDGDPDWYRAKEQIDKKIAAYKKLSEQQGKSEAELYVQNLKKEQENYKRLIPEWVDTAEREKDLNKIEEKLLAHGVPSELLPKIFQNGLYHSGFLKMLRDGALYADMKSEQAKPQFATGRQGVAGGQARVQRKDAPSVARQQLHKTGRVDDAQAAVRELLGE